MSSNYKTITIDGDAVLTLTLNRPDMHNAFDETMISDITDFFSKVKNNQTARVIVVTGAGKSFCAGADLNWMKRMGQFSREENLADAERLSAMFKAMTDVRIPIIASVNGAALGGGAGLVCASDIAIASDEAKIGFSEVRLGLLPGVISPYVIERTGPKKAARLFMTGERLRAAAALDMGLLDIVVAPGELGEAVKQTVDMILEGGPEAVKACKRLARKWSQKSRDEFAEYCTVAISEARASDEGKEGVTAFLEKRRPGWRCELGDK